MAVTPESVIKELKANKYLPVYFLQGEEPYYIDLISDYIEKNCLQEGEKGFNQTILYGKDVNISTILQYARRFPMMSDRQVVLIKEAQEISDLGKEQGDSMLLQYVQKPLTSTILVFCHKYKTLDARKTLAKNLDKHAIVVTSKKIYDNQLPDWVSGYFAQKGFSINAKAGIMLAEAVGNNLNRLANESDKVLINLKDKKEVDEALIEKYVGISKDYNVFELQKAMLKRDILKANQIVNYFEANPKNNPLIPIIAYLFSFFSKVLLSHAAADKTEAGLAKLLQQNPYFVKDYLIAIKVFNPNHTVAIIGHLRKADIMSKGIDAVSITEGQILKELVFKILH